MPECRHGFGDGQCPASPSGHPCPPGGAQAGHSAVPAGWEPQGGCPPHPCPPTQAPGCPPPHAVASLPSSPNCPLKTHPHPRPPAASTCPLTPPHAPFSAPPCSPVLPSVLPSLLFVLHSVLLLIALCAPLTALRAPLSAPLRSIPPASCPSISPPSRGSSQGWSAWSPAPGQARWSLDGVSVPVFLLDIPHPHEQPAPRTQDAGVRVWAGVCPVGSARPSLVDGGREGAGQAGGRRSPQSHRAHTPSPQASRASREVSLVPTCPLNLPGEASSQFLGPA